MPKQIQHHEFLAELAEFLQSGPPQEIGELAESIQAQLASPGDYAAAEHQPPDFQPADN